MKILIINGPNLNILNKREKNIYGNVSLEEIKANLSKKAKENSIEIDFFQSNSESEIIDKIQESGLLVDGIIINAAAYTHTSIAIRDALLAINKPFIEIHISNIYKREPFRHKSYLSDIAVGVIAGFGVYGYEYALDYILKVLKQA